MLGVYAVVWAALFAVVPGHDVTKGRKKESEGAVGIL